jgi:hypothetical protein
MSGLLGGPEPTFGASAPTPGGGGAEFDARARGGAGEGLREARLAGGYGFAGDGDCTVTGGSVGASAGDWAKAAPPSATPSATSPNPLHRRDTATPHLAKPQPFARHVASRSRHCIDDRLVECCGKLCSRKYDVNLDSSY